MIQPWLRLRSVALATFVLAAFGQSQAAQTNYTGNGNGFLLVGAYDSGDSGERYTQLVLESRYSVFQILVPNLKAGDLLFITAEGEGTTERNTNTEIVSKLTWESGSGGTTGTEISEENGENADLDEHHHKMHQTGMFRIPDGTPDGATRYVSWVWGAFDGTQTPNYLDVNQDYGRLLVLHYRPNA